MASRKTFSVETFRNATNTALATDTYNGRAHRLGAAMALEYVLHATDNYKGFRYLSRDEVPAGQAAGIIRDGNGLSSFPDDSRRFYF